MNEPFIRQRGAQLLARSIDVDVEVAAIMTKIRGGKK